MDKQEKYRLHSTMINAVNSAIELERHLDALKTAGTCPEFDEPEKAGKIAARLSEISARLMQAAWDAQAAAKAAQAAQAGSD